MLLLRPLPVLVLWITMALSLPACHLVDQRDFNAKAGLPPPRPVTVAKATPHAPALVTIRYTQPNPDYRDVLISAVHAALARKPDARFVVATLSPGAATADEAADQAAQAAASGRAVAQTIVSAGAAPAQVEQIVSIDPAAQYPEVAVNVR